MRAGLGNADEVMSCLEAAFEERSAALVFHLTHPLVDRVRGDARFTDLLRRMQLEQYAAADCILHDDDGTFSRHGGDLHAEAPRTGYIAILLRVG